MRKLLEESGFRLTRPGRGEPAAKRYEDPKWVESMRLTLDHNYAMAEFLGESGLKDTDLSALTPRLTALDQDLAARRQSGQAGFMALPYQTEVVKELRKLAKPLLEWCWDAVILGLGGAASGVRALHQALRHPQHNKFPMARRNHKLGLWVTDTIDPDYFFGLLDGLDVRRTCFNLISTDDTAATAAQFLWVYSLLKGRLGEEKARERLLITAGPEPGPFKSLLAREHFPAMTVPPALSGCFAVLSAVGLLPAVLAGIDVEELLAGARAMDQRLKDAAPERNPAYRLAALWYLFATAKKRPVLVFMPYASSLAGLAEWFGQLWAASLGQAPAGSTPVTALGASALSSQLQPYLAGPADKLITFVTVDKFQQSLEIPDSYPDEPAFGYLRGHSMEELLRVEQQAAAFNLTGAGRPSLALNLPEINPFTIGQLLYLLEVATVAAASLFGVKACDQPGFASFQQEFGAATPAMEKYRIT